MNRTFTPTTAVLAVIMLLHTAGSSTAAEAEIQAGDTVVVLQTTNLQTGTEKLAEVEAGIELLAGQVQDGWVAATIERNGKETSGWIHSGYLISDPAIAFARLTVGYESEIQFVNSDSTVTLEEFLVGTKAKTLTDLNTQLSKTALLGARMLAFSLGHSHCEVGFGHGERREPTFRNWRRQPTLKEATRLAGEFMMTGDLRRSALARQLLDSEDPTTRIERARALFNWTDRNGDGRLTLEEFVTALAGLRPTADARTLESLLAQGVGHSTSESVNLALVFALPLTDHDLMQLDAVTRTCAQGDAAVIGVATVDSQLQQLLASALASISNKCSVCFADYESDWRSMLDSRDIDAAVFIGHLNDEQRTISGLSNGVSCSGALNQLVAWACKSGKDVYVFDGTQQWDMKAGGVDVPNAVEKSGRVAWYAGNPGGDFGKFLEAVRSRESGPGQIRAVTDKNSQ